MAGRNNRHKGDARLVSPEPGEFASFYAFSTEYSGSAQFWQLMERLMAAAGREVCAIRDGQDPQELNRQGCGFGLFFDVDPTLKDIFAGEGHKLLFLRDPRRVAVASWVDLIRQRGGGPGSNASARLSFGQFVQSPAVEQMAQRYRRFAELWREERNTTLFRYEHALSGWRAIAAEIVATLKLPIDSSTAASIAAEAPPIGDKLPLQHSPPAGSPFWTSMADLEVRLADVLAAFGYAPRSDVEHPPAQVTLATPEVTLATPDKPIAQGIAAIYEHDPVLYRRLKPNASAETQVLGRRVVMDVDAAGCRPVIGQRAEGEKTLAAYGCSYTYGVAIAAEETFCSLLQGMFPAWRVENHGVAAYCTTQNLIQLERETRWNKPELVTFGWCDFHLQRNVADIKYRPFTPFGGNTLLGGPEWRIPRAALDQDGLLEIRSVKYPRRDLRGIDFSDFGADGYYLDMVCFRLFERANEIVSAYGGHFFITTLWGQLSTGLAGRLADSGIPVVAASVSGDEYTCKPDDPHPNALANRIYAERIRDYLQRYTGGQRAAPGSNDVEHQPAPASEGSQGKDTAEVTSAMLGMPIERRIRTIYEHDPVLYRRLRPNASAEVHVLGRRVVMDVDAAGYRPVIGQPAEGEKTLAVYGCSFTYGNAIAAEETFCSLLQGMFPAWRVENHGVAAYCTTQNLIQLERESRWNKPELVTFCWLNDHLRRNVADVSWLQRFGGDVLHAGAEQRLPRATLDRDGFLEMRSVRYPRQDLKGIDHSDFAPDGYYLDLVCFRLFERAKEIVTAYGGHFFITALQGQLSKGLASRLADIGIPVVDASVFGDEYTCKPDDPHPNALANRIYAERIRDYLLRYTGGQAAAEQVVRVTAAGTSRRWRGPAGGSRSGSSGN